MFSFLKEHIDRLSEVPDCKLNYFYLPRCAYVEERPTYKKTYKFMAVGQWLKQAVQKCNCSVDHIPLMMSKKLPDGTVAKTGSDELKGSGLYPPKMGEAIFKAWQEFCKSSAVPQACTVPAVPKTRQTKSDSDSDPWADSDAAPQSCRPVKKLVKKNLQQTKVYRKSQP